MKYNLAPAAALSALTLACNAAAAPPAAELEAVVQKGVAYLESKQNPDGSFGPGFVRPGLTSLAVVAMIRNGYPADHPAVAKAMVFLEKSVQPDGGVYAERLKNYSTSLALTAFQAANAGKKYDAVIRKAAEFVQSLQSGDGLAPDHPGYGGAGYEGAGRPDLSNTHIFLEGLLDAGVPKDDPAVQKALVFISRCQNRPGEQNPLEFATKATPEDKGGFVYNPQDAENPKSDRRTAAGGLRSDGSMTYAGLKSFLYAGVGKDDPRVKAAVEWIGRHYSLEENPGMGKSGLYYYYHVFAKAMEALGQADFKDADGNAHDWRQELFDTLRAKQRPDGSWANENRAFMENMPELATTFALLSLSYSRPEAGR